MYRVLIFILPTFLAVAQTIDRAAQIGYESINEADLKAHLSVLASDSLEGRETTFPGQKRAAEYIASVFRKLNLEPIGDNKTYFQHFDVDVTYVDPQTNIVANISGKAKEFLWGKEIIAESVRDTTFSAPIAFIGFSDSEADSSAKTKLAGRIIFMFIGKRETANDTSHETMTKRLYAKQQASDAAAALMITDETGSLSFSTMIHSMRKMNPEQKTMRLKASRPIEPPQFIRLFIKPEAAEEVLKSSGKVLKQIRQEALEKTTFDPIFLDNVTLTIHTHVIKETRQSENIIGLLSGSDPNLKTQVVAVTAHYDHLGKDSHGFIYHGADDDGSGTSTVLGLAEAFTKNPIRPKRSILFITMVGEEKGLLGSHYYTSHPIIPLEQTIADLNIDMIGRVDPEHEAKKIINYTYVIGSDKISLELDSLLQVTNRESERLILDYTYNDENDPEQYYRRSDHYNFAKNNVPVVFFFTGVHADYHQPSDTIDKILFNRMVLIARLIYDLSWKLGNFPHLLTKKAG